MKKVLGISLLVLSLMVGFSGLVVADDSGPDGLSDYVQASLGSGPRLDVAPGIYGQIAARADAFLTNGGHRTIYAQDLKTRMDSGERFFLMDIRLKADYDKEHIPGAVNIEFLNAAKPENLALLPTDGTKIVVICYTGHTASQTNAILNVLGYDAWILRFGMSGWRLKTSNKVWSSKVSQDFYGAGYGTEATQ